MRRKRGRLMMERRALENVNGRIFRLVLGLLFVVVVVVTSSEGWSRGAAASSVGWRRRRRRRRRPAPRPAPPDADRPAAWLVRCYARPNKGRPLREIHGPSRISLVTVQGRKRYQGQTVASGAKKVMGCHFGGKPILTKVKRWYQGQTAQSWVKRLIRCN